MYWSFRKSQATGATHLTFHGVRVDLAHVLPFVLPSDASNVECPSVVVVVRHRKSGIVGYHVLVYSEDGLCVRLDPSYLLVQYKRS